MKSLASILSLLTLIAGVGCASGEEPPLKREGHLGYLVIDVKSGAEGHAYIEATHDRLRCYIIELPKDRVVQSPQHGTYSRVDAVVHLKGGPCDGLAVPAFRYNYRPLPGYVGPDEIVIRLTSSYGSSMRNFSDGLAHFVVHVH